MANKKISTTELDFDSIKTNLKTFLKGQTQFQDYDFEGSSMSVLLDVLAYNTHYNALYKNLAVNESFLDSASKRSSVVSRAKEIGYVPKSSICAAALVDIIVSATNSTPSTLILPAYTPFATTIDSVAYLFYTTEDVITSYNSSTLSYNFTGVTIKEGTPLRFKYAVQEGQRYIIPNKNVDISTLKVKVQENSTSTNYEVFNNNENLIEITSTDPVYFIKETDDKQYEIEFGNGVIGKALSNGNVVNLEYISCSQDMANGAKTFSYQGSSLLGGITSVVTQDAANGGLAEEDTDSIRFNAPRAYTTQNRAVTVEDYKSIIYSNYPDADSVNVWGGEDNDPPIYGVVFVCIKPKSAMMLNQTQKDYVLRQVLKTKNVVSITPIIQDPTYLNVQIEVAAYYNPKLTSRTPEQLKVLVQDTITNYNENELNKFDGIIRYSNLSTLVDNTEPSIVSNVMTFKLNREVDVKYNILADYSIDIANPIYFSGVPENSVLSTGFYISGNSNVMYIEDIPLDPLTRIGAFRMFYYSNGIKVYVKTFGVIDYDKGIMTFTGLTITGIESDALRLIVKPQSNDVVSVRNQLVRILDENVSVNIIIDQIAAGNSAGNSNYIFTSSRS